MLINMVYEFHTLAQFLQKKSRTNPVTANRRHPAYLEPKPVQDFLNQQYAEKKTNILQRFPSRTEQELKLQFASLH